MTPPHRRRVINRGRITVQLPNGECMEWDTVIPDPRDFGEWLIEAGHKIVDRCQAVDAGEAAGDVKGPA